MDLLEQLDQRITSLLRAYTELKQENASLRAELEQLREESSVIKESNASLTTKLAEEENVRKNVLERVDALLQKIQDVEHI